MKAAKTKAEADIKTKEQESEQPLPAARPDVASAKAHAEPVPTGEPTLTGVNMPPRGLSTARIEEMKSQLSLLREFVAKVMVRGEHYGVIPGTHKPTLFKAGAEFLREAYGFEVRSNCVEKKVIPAAELGREKDYVEYSYRVELLQNTPYGKLSVGVCEGTCNNFERRYESLSPCVVMNTIQKMAQKRAYVGAVISATRSSNLFTQDLEDEPELAAESIQRPAEVSPSSAATEKMATPGQARLIWARLKNELKMTDDGAREFINAESGKTHSRDLTAGDIERLLTRIDERVATPQSNAS